MNAKTLLTDENSNMECRYSQAVRQAAATPQISAHREFTYKDLLNRENLNQRDVCPAVRSAGDILEECDVDNFDQEIAEINVSCSLLKDKIFAISRQRVMEALN